MEQAANLQIIAGTSATSGRQSCSEKRRSELKRERKGWRAVSRVLTHRTVIPERSTAEADSG